MKDVNAANFVRAETDHMLRTIMKMKGMRIGAMQHLREPTTPDNQPVIRMNQDTLYSATVLDLFSPVKLTLPQVGSAPRCGCINQCQQFSLARGCRLRS